MLGQLVYADEFKITAGLNVKHINVSSFKTGIYFVNTTIGDKIISRKLVITK